MMRHYCRQSLYINMDVKCKNVALIDHSWFVGTHINAWCRRVKLFSRNGVVSGNGRLHAESGKQKRLLEFHPHLCSPAVIKTHKSRGSKSEENQKLSFRAFLGNQQDVGSKYSLASSDQLAGSVLNADLGKWNPLFFNLCYIQRLSSTDLQFNQEDLQLF